MKKQILIVIIVIFALVFGLGALLFFKRDQKTTNDSLNVNSQSLNMETSQETSSDTYTLETIAAHKDASSCWMAIDTEVYDVTEFIPLHPNTRILDGCGKDATVMFKMVKKHSGETADLLTKYKIGSLAK